MFFSAACGKRATKWLKSDRPIIGTPTARGSPTGANPAPHIDVELIDTAKHEIDFAAYVLTDWPVMQALKRAADRGAKVRIYLDGTLPARADKSLSRLSANPRR
jgi:phosphatidylserine/phosphatidylglycerophosphate/cardiolipin synthase-like enzyme